MDPQPSYVTPLRAVKGVTTRFRRSPGEVRQLRRALLDGDSETGRPGLPIEVVGKILRMADHCCVLVKESFTPFVAKGLRLRFFRIGPVPGVPLNLELWTESRSRTLAKRDTAADFGRDCRRWWRQRLFGSIDVTDGTGKSKLSPTYEVVVPDLGLGWSRLCESGPLWKLIPKFGPGNGLDLYVEAHEDHLVHIKEVSMILHYDDTFGNELVTAMRG